MAQQKRNEILFYGRTNERAMNDFNEQFMTANDFWQSKENLLHANEMGFYSRTEFINMATDLVTSFFAPEICPIDALKEFLEVFFKVTNEEVEQLLKTL